MEGESRPEDETRDPETDDPLAKYQNPTGDWNWEVYEVQDRDVEVVTDTSGDEPETTTTDIYWGRVDSPMTLGWEYGTFTPGQLARASAFRVDESVERWL
jgi:hypothetical protein